MTSRRPGRKIATVAMTAPGMPFGAGAGHGPEVGRDGEQRARDGLGGAVAGQEVALADPAGLDDARVEQRQHDVAAAEDKGAGPHVRVDHGRELAVRRPSERHEDEQGDEAAEGEQAGPPRDDPGDGWRRRRPAAARARATR